MKASTPFRTKIALACSILCVSVTFTVHAEEADWNWGKWNEDTGEMTAKKQKEKFKKLTQKQPSPLDEVKKMQDEQVPKVKTDTVQDLTGS